MDPCWVRVLEGHVWVKWINTQLGTLDNIRVHKVDITYVQHFPTAVDLFYTYTEELSTSCLKIWEDSHSWARIVIVVIVIVIVVVIVIVIWGHVK